MIRRKQSELVALAILCALAGWVRFRCMKGELWIDELATAWVVRDSVADVFERSWVNNLSALYFLIVRCSTYLFGYSALGLRLPSLVAGVLLIPAIWHLVRLLDGSLVACLLASSLATFDGSLIGFSIAARPYALVQLIGTLQVCAFVELGRRGIWNASLFAFLSVMLVYLHYTTVLIFGVEFATIVVAWAFQGERNLRQVRFFAGACVAVVVLCLPLAPHLQYVAEKREVLGFSQPGRLRDALDRFQAIRYLFVPLFGGLLVDHLSSPSAKGGPDGSRRPTGAFVPLLTLNWILLPSIAVWTSARLGLAQVDLDRYVALCNVAVVVAPAIFYRRLSTRLARLTLVGLLVVATQSIYGIPNAYACVCGDRQNLIRALRPQPVGWETAAQLIRERVPAACPIFVHPALVERAYPDANSSPLLRSYLLCSLNTLYRISDEQLSRCKVWNTVEDLRALAAREAPPPGIAIVCEGSQSKEVEAAARDFKDRLPARSVVETWTPPQFNAIAVVWVGRPTPRRAAAMRK